MAARLEVKAAGLVSHATVFPDRGGMMGSAEEERAAPASLTRAPLGPHADKALDAGSKLDLACSTQRGRARSHAVMGELRIGKVAVATEIPEVSLANEIGEFTVTECETVKHFAGAMTEPPQVARGDGLVIGLCERTAIPGTWMDWALRWKGLAEANLGAFAQDAESSLCRSGNFEAAGILEPITPPHYVDFKLEPKLFRKQHR
ncbi:phosphonate metabolism protein PhnI [Aliiruegeria haliotis]|uniref:Phosphonate metabolism protein PhnI n=2 Tax=Aliiruegeria haliotis TaxID=1280846 RepID=A0A2T0RLU4_9RHOB|nr:phosphonate metabolism protein PhnI [Aliiruegeria haliotis]